MRGFGGGGGYFSSKYKTLLVWRTKKLYWRRVLGSLVGFT